MAGDLGGGRAAPLLYACFRRALASALLAERLSAGTVDLLLAGDLPAAATLVRRWFAQLTWPLYDSAADDVSDELFIATLGRAWADARDVAGDDPDRWRWAEHHLIAGEHTLSTTPVGGAWNPPPVGVGGDTETVQDASYSWPRGDAFTVTSCSVYRQVLDFENLNRSRWVIPGGASANPLSPHYCDQLPVWQRRHHLAMCPVAVDDDGEPNTS